MEGRERKRKGTPAEIHFRWRHFVRASYEALSNVSLADLRETKLGDGGQLKLVGAARVRCVTVSVQPVPQRSTHVSSPPPSLTPHHRRCVDQLLVRLTVPDQSASITHSLTVGHQSHLTVQQLCRLTPSSAAWTLVFSDSEEQSVLNKICGLSVRLHNRSINQSINRDFLQPTTCRLDQRHRLGN